MAKLTDAQRFVLRLAAEGRPLRDGLTTRRAARERVITNLKNKKLIDWTTGLITPAGRQALESDNA